MIHTWRWESRDTLNVCTGTVLFHCYLDRSVHPIANASKTASPIQQGTITYSTRHHHLFNKVPSPIQQGTITYSTRYHRLFNKTPSPIQQSDPREVLSVSPGLKKSQHFLYGWEFIMVTDHRSLISMWSAAKEACIMAANRSAWWTLSIHHWVPINKGPRKRRYPEPSTYSLWWRLLTWSKKGQVTIVCSVRAQ